MFFRTFLIFGVKINIYSNDIIDIDFLKMYEDKIDNEILYEKNIYCIKDFNILSKYLNCFDVNNAKIVKSYVKSFYYEIDDIFIRDDLSHVVEKKGKDIFFIYDSKLKNKENKLWCIIREIVHRNTEDRGGIMLHSACLSFDNDRGMLILGGKGAGKTTLATTLLEYNDYYFTSNERMLVRKEDKKALSIHYPLRFGIRNVINNTVLYQYILKNYNKLTRKQNVTLEMIEEYNKNKELKENNIYKIELEIEEYLECFNKKYRPIVEPVILIVPEISSEFDGYNIKILNKEEIYNVIKEQCYTPYDKTWIEPWIEKRMKSNEDIEISANKLITDIANKIMGIKIKFGFNFYDILKKNKKNYIKEKIEELYNKRAN